MPETADPSESTELTAAKPRVPLLSPRRLVYWLHSLALAAAVLIACSPWNWMGERLVAWSVAVMVLLSVVIICVRRDVVRSVTTLLALGAVAWPAWLALLEPRAVPHAENDRLNRLCIADLGDTRSLDREAVRQALDTEGADLYILQARIDDERTKRVLRDVSDGSDRREVLLQEAGPDSLPLRLFAISKHKLTTWKRYVVNHSAGLIYEARLFRQEPLRVLIAWTPGVTTPQDYYQDRLLFDRLISLLRDGDDPTIVALPNGIPATSARWRRLQDEGLLRPMGITGPRVSMLAARKVYMAGRQVSADALRIVDIPGRWHDACSAQWGIAPEQAP